MTLPVIATLLDATVSSSFMSNLGMMLALIAVPVVLVAGTAFLKISIVLGMIRSAVGAQDVPPTLVITALAAVLTMFVMAPVAEEMLESAETAQNETNIANERLGLSEVKLLYAAISPSLTAFLKANTSDSERSFFMELAGGGAVEDGLRILLPAFAVQELVEAFLMGFLIFLPFLAVDLIVSTTLVALGLNSLSPSAAALPLKLLLITAVDGWHIIISGLLMNYGT